MKKLLVLFVCLVFLLAGCSGGKENTDTPNTPSPSAPTKPDDAEKALLKYQKQITENGDICGVAFLGYFEGSTQKMFDYFEEKGILELFPFLEDLPTDRFIQAAGGEHTPALIARYLLLSNHSYLHCFFTHRALVSVIFAVFMALWLNIELPNRKKPQKRRKTI